MALLPPHLPTTLTRRRAIAMAAAVITLPHVPHYARAATGTGTGTGAIRVTATVGMIADIVLNIGIVGGTRV